ncbi:hypothetical protein WI665_10250, partial [Vibrio cholerae]
MGDEGGGRWWDYAKLACLLGVAATTSVTIDAFVLFAVRRDGDDFGARVTRRPSAGGATRGYRHFRYG